MGGREAGDEGQRRQTDIDMQSSFQITSQRVFHRAFRFLRRPSS